MNRRGYSEDEDDEDVDYGALMASSSGSEDGASRSSSDEDEEEEEGGGIPRQVPSLYIPRFQVIGPKLPPASLHRETEGEEAGGGDATASLVEERTWVQTHWAGLHEATGWYLAPHIAEGDPTSVHPDSGLTRNVRLVQLAEKVRVCMDGLARAVAAIAGRDAEGAAQARQSVAGALDGVKRAQEAVHGGCAQIFVVGRGTKRIVMPPPWLGPILLFDPDGDDAQQPRVFRDLLVLQDFLEEQKKARLPERRYVEWARRLLRVVGVHEPTNARDRKRVPHRGTAFKMTKALADAVNAQAEAESLRRDRGRARGHFEFMLASLWPLHGASATAARAAESEWIQQLLEPADHEPRAYADLQLTLRTSALFYAVELVWSALKSMAATEDGLSFTQLVGSLNSPGYAWFRASLRAPRTWAEARARGVVVAAASRSVLRGELEGPEAAVLLVALLRAQLEKIDELHPGGSTMFFSPFLEETANRMFADATHPGFVVGSGMAEVVAERRSLPVTQLVTLAFISTSSWTQGIPP